MGLLRVLLAVAVVFQHSWWEGGLSSVGGRNAVQMFYMISGFLICHVLNGPHAYNNILDFYRSRILRLAPVYAVVALASLATAAWINVELFQTFETIPTNATALLVLSNLFIVGQDWVMFSGISGGQLVFASDFRASEVLLYKGLLLPQAWTLAIEIYFYLCAPFILKRRVLIWGVLALSVILRVALIFQGVGRVDPWTYRFFPTELAFFMAGALAHIYLLPRWAKAAQTLTKLPAIATAILVLFVCVFALIPVSTGVKSVLLFALFLALLPLAFLHQNQSAWDRKWGELSYPVYVGHMLVVHCAETNLHDWQQGHPLQASVLNAAVALGLAIALNRWAAQPIEKYRQRFRARPSAA